MTYSDAGKYFRRFFMEDEIDNCKIYRLHLSHDDCDGYGCQVLIELARNIYTRLDNPFTVHYRNCSAGKENVEKAIKNYIHDITMKRPVYYRRGIDKILILITDLGSFDSEFLYKLREAGHNISCIYVDHHIVNTSLLGYFTDEDYYHTFEDMSYPEKGHASSTRQIFNILFEGSPINDDKVINLKDRNKFAALKKYALTVSEYDTGHWDNTWKPSDPALEDNIICELEFASYEDKTEYFLDKVEYFSICLNLITSSHEEDINYVYRLNRYKEFLYGNILRRNKREEEKFFKEYDG